MISCQTRVTALFFVQEAENEREKSNSIYLHDFTGSYVPDAGLAGVSSGCAQH